MEETTATVAAPPAGITAMDLKALRGADRICFDWHNGKGGIRCIKEVKRAGPFEDRDRTYEIADVKTEFSSAPDIEPPRVCFAMVHMYRTTWARCGLITCVDSLKVGDILTLYWSIDRHRNGYLAEAAPHLHADALYLHAKRGARVLCWQLDSSICPSNSARMVRF